eukprot:1799860-Pyramimonas_sp.AAC.1
MVLVQRRAEDEDRDGPLLDRGDHLGRDGKDDRRVVAEPGVADRGDVLGRARHQIVLLRHVGGNAEKYAVQSGARMGRSTEMRRQ